MNVDAVISQLQQEVELLKKRLVTVETEMAYMSAGELLPINAAIEALEAQDAIFNTEEVSRDTPAS